MTAESIRSAAHSLQEKLLNLRHHLHANPELSFKEFKTAEFLSAYLRSEGLDVREGIAGTGLLVTIKGKPGGKEIALRADMDALPIQEKNAVSYRSVNDGVMHACGHDVHMTCLAGALLILHQLRDHFQGTVKAIFQPGEEKLPGGATLVLKEGVFDPPPACILGQHVFPELPAGRVGFREGPYMASTDELHITVKGRGGHAALPERNINPVPLAASLILKLDQVARQAPEGIPTIIAVGKVTAAGATNVIPDEVQLQGTFRTMDESWRQEAHKLIKKIADEVVAGSGATCETTILKGYPVLDNNRQVTAGMKQAAIEYLGNENVVDLDIRMTAEDFAWYTHYMPGCFYRLGTASPDGSRFTDPVHASTFNIDESALVTGAGLMSWLALHGLTK